MNKQDFLNAMNRLDAQYLKEAEERTQCPASEEGEEGWITFTVERMDTIKNPKAGRIRKHINAVAAAAAAVGAVILSASLVKPQELSHPTESHAATSNQTAESSEITQKDYSNMNLSAAEIIVPRRDEYHRLVFACEPFTSANSAEYFQEAYEIYFGETITTAEMLAFGVFTGIPTADIFHTYHADLYDGAGAQLDVYFDALPEEKFSDVRYVRALNDRCYMDMNNAYMFEIYNRTFINELVGDTSEYEFSWRPSFDGSTCGTKRADEDCSYSLYGTNISLQEAFSFAENYFSNNNLGRINSPIFTYRREQAEVYRFGETNYGYYMWLKPCYDGIPVGAYDAFSIEPQLCAEGNKRLSNATMKCLMAREGALDWLWTVALSYEKPTEKAVYASEELLTMEEAAVYASEALTDGITFDISEVQLYYAFGSMYDDADDTIPAYLFIEPSWQFVMPANSSLYQRIVVDVSAINGDVVVRYE